MRKEIRVGNFIDLGNRIAKVEEIYHEGCTVIDLEEIQDTIESYERISPITINEEWHNKFGVYLNGFKSFEYLLPQRNNFDLKVVFNGDYVMLRQGDGNIDDDICSIWNRDLTRRDMYVHEWQNLYFSLSGEELVSK